MNDCQKEEVEMENQIENQMVEDKESILDALDTLEISWRDCMQILSAIKAARYKINKKREADQRKGRFPPEGRADINLYRLEHYDDLFGRFLKLARILEKRYKQENK